MSISTPVTQIRHSVLSPRQAFTRRALTRRLLPISPPTVNLLFWLIPLLTTLLAGVLRFVHLAHPHMLIFDETYYVKDAYALLHYGHEMQWDSESDTRFIAGDPQLKDEASFVVHPPLGKWLIGVGMLLFGEFNGFGWRFSGALLGTLAVLLLTLIARRLFNSHILGGIAGLLLAIDGHSIVMSRTALLDIFLMFFILAAFYAILIDRTHGRRQLINAMAVPEGNRPDIWFLNYGPLLWFRPWRMVAAVMLGCALGVKLSALPFIAAFGLLTVFWDLSARRGTGIRHWIVSGLWRDGIIAFFTIIPLTLITYVTTWAGWFTTSGGRYRQWAAENPDAGIGWLPPVLRSLAQYHQAAFDFHTGLSSPHGWQSSPWTWPFAGRPVLMYFEGYDKGANGCTLDRCTEVITDLPNPILWWSATICMLLVMIWWLGARDWRAGAILAAPAAGFLPWLLYPERTMFFFYTLPLTPFMMLAVAYVIGRYLPATTVPYGARNARIITIALVLAVFIAFSAFFWPVWAGEMVSNNYWQHTVWIPSWG